MERQNFSKNSDKEAKRKIERCLEKRLALEERNTLNNKAKNYFANVVLEKLKTPAKPFIEILQEEVNKTSCQSFLIYVSMLSQMLYNEIPTMEEIEKVVERLEATTIRFSHFCNLTPGRYSSTRMIIIKKALEERGIKNAKIKQIIWQMAEEEISLEEAIERSFGNGWTENQIEEFFGTEIYEDEKFLGTIQTILQEVEINELVEEYCDIKEKRRKYPFKTVLIEMLQQKRENSNTSIIKICGRILEKYGSKYNIPSIYWIMTYLLKELEVTGVNENNIIELSNAIEKKMEVFMSLLSEFKVKKEVA